MKSIRYLFLPRGLQPSSKSRARPRASRQSQVSQPGRVEQRRPDRHLTEDPREFGGGAPCGQAEQIIEEAPLAEVAP